MGFVIERGSNDFTADSLLHLNEIFEAKVSKMDLPLNTDTRWEASKGWHDPRDICKILFCVEEYGCGFVLESI